MSRLCWEDKYSIIAYHLKILIMNYLQEDDKKSVDLQSDCLFEHDKDVMFSSLESALLSTSLSGFAETAV